MRYKIVLTLTLSTLLYSCTTTQSNSILPKPTLEQFDRVTLGAHKQEIEAVFGKPSEILSYPEEADIANWLYSNDSGASIIFVINKKSDLLLAKTWEVYEEENPIIKLEDVLARYPKAHFKKRSASTRNPHYVPDEAWIEDRSIGLSIEIRNSSKQVRAISWFAPGTPVPQEIPCIKFRKDNGLISCKN